MSDKGKKITLEEAEILAMSTDYACFANEDTIAINKADAAAFYMEGYNAAIEKSNSILNQLKEDARWKSFATDELPKIGDLLVCKKGDSYYIYKPVSHDSIHWLAENNTHWRKIVEE